MASKPVAFGAAACLIIGWLAASLLSPPVAQLQTRQAGRTVRGGVKEPPPVAFTETLKLKLQRNDTAPSVRRNPFVFGGRAPSPSPLMSASEVDRPAEPPPAPAIVTPPYSLSGIAASTTPEGEIRTAVLSDGRAVYLVKAGETLNGYTVAAVDRDAVTLIDASGARFAVRLR
jgi:hypothetical protein